MSEDRWHLTRRTVLQAMATGALVIPLYGTAYPQLRQSSSLEDHERQFFTDAEWAFILAATARLIPSDGEGPGAIEARVPVFIDLQLAGPFGEAADWYMEGPHWPDAPAELGFQSPLPPARIYRQGMEVFNAWCERTYGNVFADLEPAQQDEALKKIEGKAQAGAAPEGEVAESSGPAGTSSVTSAGSGLPLEPELRDFFSLLLQNTKEGYFADPRHGGNHRMLGWLHIGFPGARAAYREWADKWDVPYRLGPVSIAGERI